MNYFLDLKRLENLRYRTFALIKKELEKDGHCKSYEGTVSVVFPNYFRETGQDTKEYSIEMSCYLLCNGRHESFSGSTFDECLDQFEEWVSAIETEGE